MTVDHCNLNQPAASVTGAVLHVVVLSELINKASGLWYATMDLTSVLFSVPIMNENQKTCIHREQAKILYNSALWTVNSLVLCHNIVQRDLDCQLVLIISVTAPRPITMAKLWSFLPTSHSKSPLKKSGAMGFASCACVGKWIVQEWTVTAMLCSIRISYEEKT